MTLALSIRQPWVEAWDSEAVQDVYLWATLNGMAGPLPPLPERLAKH
jgi:hypothetical protein